MTDEPITHPNDEPFRPLREDHHLADALVQQSVASAKLDTFLGDSIVALSQPSGKTPAMTAPAPGSFAASIRAMMDEARAGLAQARTDGLAQVGAAIGDMSAAKVAIAKVSTNMASTIKDEAASIMSELGQISNDL